MEELEEVMILADLGVDTTRGIIDNVREKVKRNELHIERLVDITAHKTSAIFKLPHKGRIEVGMDADFVLLDADLRPRFVAAAMRSSVEPAASCGR